jgi:hypothetical protein
LPRYNPPLTLHGQVIGGVVQGLGGAFMENLVYDGNGQLLTGNLTDYLIPTATDFQRIRAIALENHPSPSNPLGVKGAGEGAITQVRRLDSQCCRRSIPVRYRDKPDPRPERGPFLRTNRQARRRKRPSSDKILLPPAAPLKNEERLSRSEQDDRFVDPTLPKKGPAKRNPRGTA